MLAPATDWPVLAGLTDWSYLAQHTQYSPACQTLHTTHDPHLHHLIIIIITGLTSLVRGHLVTFSENQSPNNCGVHSPTMSECDQSSPLIFTLSSYLLSGELS